MALNYDATGRYLSRNSDLLNYNAAYTWMTWGFSTNTGVNDGTLFTVCNSTAALYDAVWVKTDGSSTSAFLGTDLATSTAYPVGAESTWHHYAMIRESPTSLKLYVDGVLASTITNAMGTARSLALNYFGEYDGLGGARWVGRLGVQKSWSRALTLDEVRSERRKVLPASFTSLHGCSPHLRFEAFKTKDILRGRHWTENGIITEGEGPPVSWGAQSIIVPGASVSLAQEGFRFFNDDGSESTATGLAAQDVNASLAPDTPTRLRMLIDAAGDPSSSSYRLQHRKVGDPSWKDVT